MLLLFLLCVTFFTGLNAQSPAISQETIEQRRDAIRIFEFRQVDKEHACSLIRCSDEDVCAVLDDVALCISRAKAKQIVRDATGSKDGSAIEIIEEKPNAKSKPKKHRKHPTDESAAFVHHHGKSKSHHSGYAFKIDDFHGMKHFPRKHIEEYNQPCTEKELVTVEDLLMNWFTALRKQSTNAETVSLPRHHVRCHPDVGWMFAQLDANRDGHLEHDEMYKLDHEKYKNCIHHFLDQCDTNQNALLSVDEWCDCFEWAGREREEPPCHAARRLNDPHLIGAFVPRCDAEGFYRPEQCHEAHCWCVDKWGREFDHSRNNGHADCGQYAEYEQSQEDDDDDDDDDDVDDDAAVN